LTDVYADVEALLTPGYVTQTVTCAGVTVSVRSMYPSDQHLLRVRAGTCRTARDWKVVAVSHALWEVDGHVVDAADTGTRRRLCDMVAGMTAPVLDAMYAAVATVRARMDDAASVFEAYCYEPQSRANWRSFGRRCPSRQAPAWVVGAGPNTLQRLWVSFNMYEDDRVQWENDWYAATTVAATMASKWVKEIRQEESSRWKTEVDRRNAVIQRARNPHSHDDDEEDVSGIRVVRHRTADDLVEQMKRWQRGELDEHDQIVQSYKDNIRRRHEEERETHARRMEALDQALAEGDVGAAVVGYTPEQMAELGLSAPTRTRRVYSSGFSGRLYDKYLNPDIPVGGLRPDGKGGDMDARQPIGDAVAGRRVTVPDVGGV
jgi:hypothetical protein